MQENPDQEEKIQKKTLMQCITDHIDDDRLKATAKRATWLGNDETHYVRRWESKDIDDLKVLVRLTCNWIETVVLSKQYVEEMPDEGPHKPDAEE